MAEIKVTSMSNAVALTASDYLMIIQDGTNKKINITTFLKNLNSGDNIRINALQNAVDTTIMSKNDSSLLVLKGAIDRIGIGTNNPSSKLHIVGNLQIGSSSTDGITVQSSENLVYTSADQTNIVTKIISPLRELTQLDCNTGVNGLFSLSSGSNGQFKTIFVNTLDGGKTASISITGLGFTTITLNAIGKSTVLQYVSAISKWVVVGGNGAIYS